MPITVAEIERDLRNLWQEMAKNTQKEEGYAVTRACVFNLLIYAPGERSDQEINQMMGEVTAHNPGRIIILLKDDSQSPHEFSAWVSAQCHLSGGRRKQVCCEQVMIRTGGSAMDHLASFIIPLLLPDLPVFLWWRDELKPDNKLLQDLVEVSDRIIFDSAKTKSDSLPGMLHFIRENRTWTAFSDFNWGRLTTWRLAIAQLYDVPEWRSKLENLNKVEVRLSSKTEMTLPALLISWLATRLNWKLRSAPTKITETEHRAEFEKNGNRIVTHFFHDPSKEASAFEIKLIAGDQNLEFEISQNQSCGGLQVSLKSDGRSQVVCITKLDSDEEAMMIGKELEILGHDVIFEKALELVDAFLVR